MSSSRLVSARGESHFADLARADNMNMMQMGGAGNPENSWGERPRVASAGATLHPLLVDTPASDQRLDAPSRRQRGGRGPEYDAWVNNIEQILGPGGVDTLQELLGAHGLAHLSGPDQLRVGIAPGPDGTLAMVIDPSPALAAQAAGAQNAGHARGHHHHRPVPTANASTSTRSTSRQLGDRVTAACGFVPLPTVQRWQEESRMMTQGEHYVEVTFDH